jgi:hypothetical protein
MAVINLVILEEMLVHGCSTFASPVDDNDNDNDDDADIASRLVPLLTMTNVAN